MIHCMAVFLCTRHMDLNSYIFIYKKNGLCYIINWLAIESIILGEIIMGKYFGTDGFRGEANVDLTVEHAYKVGRFLGWYFGQEHKCKVVIGKDTRRSSYMFEYALASGLTASGADAYLLHVTTTPSVSYVVRTEDFDCGIMISASHNPYYDNGIKLLNGAGEKMSEDVIEKIEAYLDGELGEIPFAVKDAIGCTTDYVMGRNRYMGYLISLATRSFKGIRVGLDCSNGSAWSMAKSIFDALGAKTYVINNEPDGTNINMNCGSTHIEVLQNTSKTIIWMWALPMMVMRIAVLQWMRTDGLLTEI